MKKKKLWLVKREVLAYSITDAIKAKGRVYEVQETREEPAPQKQILLGFNKKP